MSWWYPSWFPALPTFNFAVPANIQRHFFSFLLRRTLGHFLKPGQLDLHQIDSQLGSGIVQVKDLELDGQAINQLLVGLPLSLYDGFISSATARIPFPNPLSSSVGLRLQSLNLTFQITQDAYLHGNSSIADSVASVAETFVHYELTPKEGTTLRQTLKPSAAAQPLADESENFPGGFCSFGYNVNAEEALQGPHGDDDPAGVSVFAALIERLLAKFQFLAVDTKVTIVCPGRASFTLFVPEIAYRTDLSSRSEANGDQSASGESDSYGQIRTVSISGLKVTSRDLRVVASSPTVTSTISPVSLTSSREPSPLHHNQLVSQLSRSSSSSSLDEDAQFMMSQSIAMLPPNSPHLSSASDSMYQSAVSTAQHVKLDGSTASLSIPQDGDKVDGIERTRPHPAVSVLCREPVEDVILSFGSQPIVFSLQIPSGRIQPSEQILQASGDQPAHADTFVPENPEQEVFQLSITVGTLACAFRSRHLRVLLDIVDACTPKPPMLSPIPRKEAPSALPRALCLEADVVIRGIVIIALPEPATEEAFSLDTFYDRPLVPPKLPRTYLRLFLDTVSTSFRVSTSPPDSPASAIPPTPSYTLAIVAQMVVTDISLFAFHSILSVDDPQVAAPILITDTYSHLSRGTRHRPSLTSQKAEGTRLPGFEVVDWTQVKFKRGSAKLSTWRSKSRGNDKFDTPSQRASNLPSSPNPFIPSPSSVVEDKLPMSSAVEISGRLVLPFSAKSRILDVKMAPLHFFFDLGMIFKDNLAVHFVEDVASASIFTRKTPDLATGSQPFRQQGFVDSEKDTRIQQTSTLARERDEERRRLEALVSEDLNLGMNYPQSSPRLQPASLKPKKAIPNELGFSFRLICQMIRVEIRCPPPLGYPPRSGCMLLDLHGLKVSSNFPSTKSSPLRFTEGTTLPPRSGDKNSSLMLSVCLHEILAAYSSVGDSVAHTILTLGSSPTKDAAPDASALFATESVPDPLPLSVVLGRPDVTMNSSPRKLSVIVDIPLVNLVMDKPMFDGLQCWADDVAQLIGRSLTDRNGATETHPSRNPSLIGSRFFTRSRHSDTRGTDESISEESDRSNAGEIAVKVNVTEVLLRFIIPRNGDLCHARPFDISTLGVDVLIELKPEGKDESVITAGVTDFCVTDASNEGDYAALVESPPRSISSAARPTVKCRITSLAVPETTAKESRIKLSLWGFTIRPPLDPGFGNDLAVFAKAPPGVFESVVPSERTRLTVSAADVSVHLRTPNHPGAAALHLGEAEFSTELVGNSPESAFKLKIGPSHIYLVDSIQDALESTGTGTTRTPPGLSVDLWKKSGYALIAEISHFQVALRTDDATLPTNTSIVIERAGFQIHLCADTINALTNLISDVTRTSRDDTDVRSSRFISRTANTIAGEKRHGMTASLDEHAFRLIPEVGNTADMISDDLPANMDYLDASFGTAAGLRELRDDDLEDFDMEEQTGRDSPVMGQLGIVSNVGGETVRILKPFSFAEHYFDTISPDTIQVPDRDTTLRIRIHDSDLVLFLHDGYDWPRTRKIIEKEVKEMRRKLARIRQLVATGQTPEPLDKTTSATLFNSFHVGLEQDLENMDPDTLIAAIDEELGDSVEIGTDSSWQSLYPASPGRPQPVSTSIHGKRLTRSKGPSIEIRLEGLNAEIDHYRPGETLVSRTLILVRNLEILDHIKTSTWKKFLTDMRSDSRGNVRETNSNMARVELLSVRPSQLHPVEEARLRVKILPLRLYVDQDALDFFKRFFAFQDPDNPSAPDDGEKKEDIYFQHAEVFPVDIKLDYKPRRVDYKALRDGRTIELMNFFHFDGAEMTLRHLTLHGITGWPRFFDTLNDLWTPDVKATQLVDVISGVAPIRSVVNVGSGVADLVLLPIAQYKKDGRIVRGVQKGTKAFVQSTAMEAIKLGARLATGTQVILEQAEIILGGQFQGSVTTEALQIPYGNENAEGLDEELISRYAAQPAGLKEGVQSAYQSLQRNLLSAAQTILAVPMEVYEKSGDEGAVRAVVRAVPIAVLKPMIGASEAVSKTLMGLHNTLDPNVRLENEAKYKHR